MEKGWIKVYRSLMDKGWYRDSEYVHLWCHLMMMANHTGREWWYKDRKFDVKRGSFVTSRQSLSRDTGIQESKIERILKCFKDEQQIEQENLYTSRLISIVNYEKHQSPEQQDEQSADSKKTASEQQMNTTKELKNLSIEENTVISSPDGDGETESDKTLKAEYSQMAVKDIKSVSEFVKGRKPKFPQPYMDLWNLFCDKHGKERIKIMSDGRKRKLRTRLSKDEFDFVAILGAASKQPFALEGRWFTFDWVVENDTNFAKVLENKYKDPATGSGGGEGGGIDLTRRAKNRKNDREEKK